MRNNIILLGFMGTGKTSVGRLVASRLGLELVDMDGVIESRQGKPISRIFSEDGEPCFRRLERELVQELAGRTGLVVAAGGGVVLNPLNIADFARTGVPVCLTADPQTILRRVESETHRPLLEDGDKSRKILELLEKRRPLYESLPFSVDTTDLTPDQVADRVIEIFRAETDTR